MTQTPHTTGSLSALETAWLNKLQEQCDTLLYTLSAIQSVHLTSLFSESYQQVNLAKAQLEEVYRLACQAVLHPDKP